MNARGGILLRIDPPPDQELKLEVETPAGTVRSYDAEEVCVPYRLADDAVYRLSRGRHGAAPRHGRRL